MKRAFLLIIVSTLLVALGFAQTPAATINTDQTNIKGCLGGSDGNYTAVEDNTGRVFKITTSSVDLKPHLSHDVTLIGHRASGASSAATDNSFAVTELNMISEHCAAAAVAPAATTSTVAENAITPAAAATPPAETALTPAADAAAPAATVSTPLETASKPAARPRRRSETSAVATTTPAVTASSSSKNVSTPAADAPAPAATVSTPSETTGTSAAVATTPTANSGSWSLWLWIAFAVLVIVIGTLFPFFSRWRKRKSLERTGTPNLSFTREVSSDQGKSDKQEPRKAA